MFPAAITLTDTVANAPRAAGVQRAYVEHAACVYRAARYLGVPEADLEDVLHEVFVIAYRRWHEIEQRERVRSFLYGVCANVALAHRRRARARREVVHADVGHDLPGAPDEAPDAAAIRTQQRVHLMRALDRLDADKRLVIVLYDIEGQSMEDAARAAGCPTKTAYSRLYAARAELRAALEGTYAKEGT